MKKPRPAEVGRLLERGEGWSYLSSATGAAGATAGAGEPR